MVARNANILSGILHVILFASILIFASKPPGEIKPMQRYRSVRLVSLPGRPGPPPEKKVEVQKPEPVKAKPKVQPKQEVKKETVPKEKVISTKGKTTKSADKPVESTSESKTEEKGTGEGGQSGARIDGANFPYPYYLSNLQIKILSNFKPVINAREAKGLKAIVFFVVDKSGRIADVKLESKSGHFLFDQEAQRAVLRSNPLPALPPAFGSDHLGVHFEFVASEDR